MSLTYRALLCFLALSLGLINPSLSQSKSIQNPSTFSEVNALATALVGAATEEEQEQILALKKDLINSSLLAAVKKGANQRVQKGDFAEALKITNLAVRIAERIKDRAGMADAMTDIGDIHLRQYHYPEALNYFQKALVIYEESGDKKGMASTLRLLGNLYSRQTQYDQALDHYNRALALSEQSGERSLSASILNDFARAHDSLGHFEHALELFKKSQAICEELNDDRMLATILNNIGILYIDQSRYIDALEYLQKSIKIIEKEPNVDKPGLGVRLNNIGIIYKRQGRYDQALEYYRKSLEIVEECKNQIRIAEAQNNIGVIYKAKGLYEQSLEWLHKSLENFKAVKANGGIAASLNNIGDVHRRQGRYDLALAALRESLHIREEIIKDPLSTALTLNNLGRLYQVQGRYSEMLEVSRRAADLTEGINDPEGHWTARNSIGIALRALGQPAAARQSFLDAITTLELLRHQVAGGAQQQQSFLENRLSPWINLIDLLVAQCQHIDALTFAEQSKARVLIDSLQGGDASLRKSLSLQERQMEEQKRLELVALNSQLTREHRRAKTDLSRVNELKVKIAKARLEFESLQTSLYVAHPELKVHRGEASIINAEELSALMPDASSAALEYVVAGDKTFLFVITKSAGKGEAEISVYTLPIKRDDLANQTEAFRQQLGSRDLSFRRSAAKLYEVLLKPAEAQLRGKTNLVIVPDDKLWELPFQALLNGNRFLIEEAAIAYAPSLTALREMRKRRKSQDANPSTATLLALGNPQLGKETINRFALALRDERLDPLPEAEQEVKALKRLYGTSRSKVYIGAEAREDRVKSEASRAGILHFATHGMLNNTSPMYSHLALAQSGANEDGLLEAWELMQLDLKAELAVLSACETARGRFGAGEGVTGLTWALFVAGVPSTVVSQWKVESAGTRDLMLSFHRQLTGSTARTKGKATKAEALRQAALMMMKKPGTSHPFYWAGFVLVGDGQ